MISMRQRNRLNAMRTTQRSALERFTERGFDEVTVGEIASEVGMAASTLYRHFDTKEDIVIWDEHDTAIDKTVHGSATAPQFLIVPGAFTCAGSCLHRRPDLR